jgi:DNA polymerase-1
LSDNISYEYVTDHSEFAAALATIGGAPVIGFDVETTGLDPHRDRLRLLSLSTTGHTYVVDTWRLEGWQDLVRPIFSDKSKTVIAHNARFDLRFLLANGIETDAVVHDTMIASQLLEGGRHLREEGYFTLGSVAQRMLGQSLDKEQQKSDWGAATLSGEQLAYTARDAGVLLPLYEHEKAALDADGLQRVAALEAACTPALAWLELAGMPFDAEAWRLLSDGTELEEQRLGREIMAIFTALGANQFGGFRLKLTSKDQLRQALDKLGIVVENTDEETLVAVRDAHPVVPLILAWRGASKRAGTYGIEFVVKYVHALTGRVHGEYWQIGGAAGRMSCEHPNMQNVPRSRDYRACFRPEEGRALVRADYVGIELRLAAVIAHDKAMLDAYRAGEDLHRRTAATVLGVPADQVTGEQRQLAKALNFGLLYGMGPDRLISHATAGFGVTLTREEAERYRDRFFATYSGLRRWHRAQPDGDMITRTLAGRPRVVREGTKRDGTPINIFSQKVNSPVQGSGADGLKLALGRLWRHRDEVPTARLVATVHDDVVAECPAADASVVAAWLVRHMREAMEEIVDHRVPIEVEATIGRDWAGTPLEGVAAPHGTPTLPSSPPAAVHMGGVG